MALTRLGPNNSTNISGINLTSQVTGTLPTANGGTGATSFAAGKVLQSVNVYISSGDKTTTSSTFSDVSGASLSITPSATSSKILVQISGTGRQNDDGKTAKYTVYRDSTNLDATGGNGFSEISVTGGTYIKTPYVITFLDSPSTTSSVKYSLYMKNQTSTTCRACHNNTDTTVTLMEIAG